MFFSNTPVMHLQKAFTFSGGSPRLLPPSRQPFSAVALYSLIWASVTSAALFCAPAGAARPRHRTSIVVRNFMSLLVGNRTAHLPGGPAHCAVGGAGYQPGMAWALHFPCVSCPWA